MDILKQKLRDFLRDDDGSALAEATMILPMLIWTYLAFFVYWDAYKTTNVAQKAAYTIADLVSREQTTLPATYVPGMRSLYRFLVGDQVTPQIRVTSLLFSEGNNVRINEDDADDRTLVQWSVSPDQAVPAYTDATIQDVLDRIPAMYDGDSVILVETFQTFNPIFDVGMSSRAVNNFVVTRPRFLPKICMTGVTC